MKNFGAKMIRRLRSIRVKFMMCKDIILSKQPNYSIKYSRTGTQDIAPRYTSSYTRARMVHRAHGITITKIPTFTS